MEEESGDTGTHVGKDLRWYRSEKSINRLVALVVKNLPANAGDTGDAGSITRLGRSPEGGHGNLFQYSKYWSFSFNISLSNEHLGLISLRMDWLDLLAV